MKLIALIQALIAILKLFRKPKPKPEPVETKPDFTESIPGEGHKLI